ncbi:hypothetical protein [Streptomyces marincola]|uniref:Uncharacterized protein n=1 Tax=Streptomyces marincola TaxID=2878388 RepID=A0A1W7CTM0_9ACTN|nr:hypothetical protein [Streptomyces marincola]ARQ68173.1 hypothetical protein CAG99_04355 [Streptomyces marincola]
MTDDPYRPAGQPDLFLPDGELSEFVGWLEAALESLRDSRLTPEQVNALSAEAGQFGQSSAAAALFTRYEEVRARLESFVRVQQDAMEMLGITTTLMENDYQATEVEQVDRLNQIIAGMTEVYTSPGSTPEGRAPGDSGSVVAD